VVRHRKFVDLACVLCCIGNVVEHFLRLLLRFSSRSTPSMPARRGKTVPRPRMKSPPTGRMLQIQAWLCPSVAFKAKTASIPTRETVAGEIDGTNTRWRLGIAPCFEIFADIPTYFANIKAPGGSGWTDVAPAVKWQISPLPGKIDLSVTAGIFLPTGTAAIAGRGSQTLSAVAVVMGIA